MPHISMDGAMDRFMDGIPAFSVVSHYLFLWLCMGFRIPGDFTSLIFVSMYGFLAFSMFSHHTFLWLCMVFRIPNDFTSHFNRIMSQFHHGYYPFHLFPMKPCKIMSWVCRLIAISHDALQIFIMGTQTNHHFTYNYLVAIGFL